MKTFKIKLKNTLSNSNSNYYKKFGGVLTKYVNVKTKADLKCIPNYNNIISIEEV